jgi:hypothetical protein
MSITGPDENQNGGRIAHPYPWRTGMTRLQKSLLVLALLVLIGGGFMGLRGVQARTFLAWYSPRMMILVSPNRSESVFLLAEGFQERFISLYVPLAKKDGSVKRIVSFTFPNFDAVWSGDGSVLAFGYDDQYFFAYDFGTGQGISGGGDNVTDRSDRIIHEDSESIKAVVEERGAPKYRIPCSMGQTFVPISYSQWRKLP